jgi:hypothetical protein
MRGAIFRRALLVGCGTMPALAARSQTRPRRIAWISEATHPFDASFRSGLADAGLVEHREFVISTQYFGGASESMEKVARALDHGEADIVVASPC